MIRANLEERALDKMQEADGQDSRLLTGVQKSVKHISTNATEY